MKKRIAILLIILALITGAVALSQTIDDQLRIYDQYVARQFSFFPRDARYDAYMNSIAQNLNSVIVETFGEDKNITFYICPSRLGFNAVSFYRFIVFDSLLLDSLRYLAMGKVYYGNLNNQYIDTLVSRVAEISQAHQMGFVTGNYYDINNPFNLPPVGPLNQQQQLQAEELFTSMLVSWMAHEGSHCMRDHMKYRLQVMQQQQMSINPYGNQQQFINSMSAYMNAKLTQKLEKDADVHAVKWLINAGYNIEGFITWLQFGEKLERIMGVENAYLRTHPKCSERIKYIRETARSLTGE